MNVIALSGWQTLGLLDFYQLLLLLLLLLLLPRSSRVAIFREIRLVTTRRVCIRALINLKLITLGVAFLRYLLLNEEEKKAESKK